MTEPVDLAPEDVALATNETLRVLLSHRSDRSYTAEPIGEADLTRVLEAARHAPTWTNAQHVSLVVVRDAERRATLAQLCGRQPWIAQAPVFIAVVADYHKTARASARAGGTQQVHLNADGLCVCAVDCGVALAGMMAAAHSLGLGVCPIGGLRLNPGEVVELLGLPPLTMPMVGMTLGHIERRGHLRPRMPLAGTVHYERYDDRNLDAVIDAYDPSLEQHWRNVGRSDGLSWTANTHKIFGTRMFEKTGPVLRQQQFEF